VAEFPPASSSYSEEQASPYSRAPLSDTLTALAASEPVLMTLTSATLHPASWLSIAWYPIYRIPVGRSLRDLSACFLTYHALSTAAGEGKRNAENNAPDVGGGGEGGGGDDDGGSGGDVGGGDGGGGEDVGEEDAAAAAGGAVVVEADARSDEWMAAGGCPAPPPVSVYGEAAMASRMNRLHLSGGGNSASRPRIALRWGVTSVPCPRHQRSHYLCM